MKISIGLFPGKFWEILLIKSLSSCYTSTLKRHSYIKTWRKHLEKKTNLRLWLSVLMLWLSVIFLPKQNLTLKFSLSTEAWEYRKKFLLNNLDIKMKELTSQTILIFQDVNLTFFLEWTKYLQVKLDFNVLL